MASRYVEIMSKRKEALFKGDEATAAKLFTVAEKLVKQGKVSDDEFLAAAYL